MESRTHMTPELVAKAAQNFIEWRKEEPRDAYPDPLLVDPRLFTVFKAIYNQGFQKGAEFANMSKSVEDYEGASLDPMPKISVDPTLQQMRAHLENTWGLTCDPDDTGIYGDAEEAIYWFSHDWHCGQGSNLYEALSACAFRSSIFANRPEPDSMAMDMYTDLQATFF